MHLRTRAELVSLALTNLGVLAAGQPVQAEDSQKINDALPSIIETLRVTEVFYLNNIESIDEAVYEPLAAVVAWACRSKFSIIDPQELQTLKDQALAGNAALKIMSRGKPTYQPLQSEYI